MITKVWNQRRIKKTSRTKKLIKQESRASKPNPSSSLDDEFFSLDEDSGFEEPVPEEIDISSPRMPKEKLTLSKSMNLPVIAIQDMVHDDLALLKQRGVNPATHSLSEQREDLKAVDPSKRMSMDISQLRPDSLKHKPRTLRSFGSKDDLTLHWEDGKKPTEKINVEEAHIPSRDAVETKAEVSEEEVDRPSGTFDDHVKILNPPAVKGVFQGLSCQKLYTKIMSNQKFWEYTLKQQENKKAVVAELRPSSDHPDVMYERECTFISPIKGAPMGPKETRVIQNHRLSMPNEQ